jgi:rhomboid protease GluP
MIGFYAGRFGLAERDLARVMLTHPHGYWASTLFLARARSGKDGSQELRKYADGTKETGWPMPIVRFHLAELDGDGLLAAAAHADPKIAKNRECEARYHLGQKRLLDGDRREAESQFRQAEAGCPRSFFEYVGAVAELQRLK